MNARKDQLEEALNAVLAGRLDALSPEAVARLEERLRHDPELDGRLAAASAVVEPGLREAAALPTADEWDAVWRRVDSRGGSSGAFRRLRLIPPALLAAAACLALALVWNLGRPPVEAGAGWPVQWAQQVEVESLEVSDAGTPFVFTVGTDEPVSVIWVLPG